MVVHGHKTTLPITVETMCQHIKAVVRGATNKFIIGDLPFCSYRKGLEHTMHNVDNVMKEGAHAIKLEGADDNTDIIQHIVKSGIPVMGHLGLLPQSVHQLGGFRRQATRVEEQDVLLADAVALQEAGAFAIVLECVPDTLARDVSQTLRLPIIGIDRARQLEDPLDLLLDDGIRRDQRRQLSPQYFRIHP